MERAIADASSPVAPLRKGYRVLLAEDQYPDARGHPPDPGRSIERPETGVVILSQHDDESYVWALLEHGVAGYGYLHVAGLDAHATRHGALWPLG